MPGYPEIHGEPSLSPTALRLRPDVGHWGYDDTVAISTVVDAEFDFLNGVGIDSVFFFFFFFKTRTVVSSGQNRHGFYRDSTNEDRQIDGGYAENHILYF